MKRYHIELWRRDGQFIGIMSGCGRNRGTWDSDHSRSAAYRLARELRKEHPGNVYKVEVGQ